MRISRINFLSSLLSPVVFEDISKRNETSKSSLILGKCTDDWIKESGFLHDADLIFHSIRPAIQKEFKERKETKKKNAMLNVSTWLLLAIVSHASIIWRKDYNYKSRASIIIPPLNASPYVNSRRDDSPILFSSFIVLIFFTIRVFSLEQPGR